MVKDVLENLFQRKLICDYEHSGSRARFDFEIAIRRNPDYFIALEVKGGEGNSINISERPIWAKEFGVWSHLDGAIVNQPSHGVHSIINRLTNELVRRGKRADMLFIKDILCGTRTKPCPKYPGEEETIGFQAAPDIFLFPQDIPSVDNPKPPVHTLETLELPSLILSLFGIPEDEYKRHVWKVQVELITLDDGRFQRYVEVRHQGEIVDRSRSRAWGM